MTTTFGKVNEYNHEDEEWRHYVERIDHFFTANEITDKDKMRSVFLVSVGAKTYRLIRSLVAPGDPKDLTYEELATIVGEHYQPKPSVIVQRFKFNTRLQQQGETISVFLAELRRLSEYCEFGSTLDEMLRDRLVCGTRDDKIQRRLLAEPKLTLKRAVDLAIAIETSEKDALDLKQNTPVGPVGSPVNTISQDTRQKPQDTTSVKCSRCDGKHTPSECRFKDAKCHACGKLGHISRACRSKNKGKQTKQTWQPTPKNTQYLSEEKEESADGENAESAYSMFTFANKHSASYKVTVLVNDTSVEMEIDTGAALSVISEDTYKHFHSQGKLPPFKNTEVILRTYTGEEVKPKGTLDVTVCYEGEKFQLPLLVVAGNGPTLLGRNWLNKIKLNWHMIKQLTPSTSKIDCLVHKYSELFEESLGTLKGTTAKIHVDPAATPVFCKARPVPYALRDRIEKDLDRLQKAGTIEPVQLSEWATPIVPVVKSDGSVRVCGDYKLTVNKVSKLDAYPIPKLDDLYTKLAGGTTFTELDLSHAYEQMLVDEESKKFMTINTHKGLYRYNRLPYGVSSAPGIFQRTMEGLLHDIPHVGVLLDNILITGATDEEHLNNIETVLKHLFDAGLRLKRSKCQFMKSSLECLGHRIDAEGFHPVPAKVEAIQHAPSPNNVSELKSFLGMVNFYGKFLPNLSSTLEPLHKLLRKGTPWVWNNAQEKAYQTAKDLLQSSKVLVHYDPAKQLVVSCDASPYGVGAVLAHKFPDGSEKPIAYASRTLTKPERGYSQLDKEALAIIFAVKKFHQFLYGRHFVIYTDHKPLLGLFNPEKATPMMASGRVQRWSLTLLGYEYELVYRPGSHNGNADSLSRLPLPETPKTTPVPGNVINLLEHINNTPPDATKMKLWTERDPVLSRVKQYVLLGWPSTVRDAELQPYYFRRDELSVDAGCLLWGSRLIVPPQGREEIMNVLHDSHPGIVRMKGIARSHIWWPKMDAAIEERVRSCQVCQAHQKVPAPAPLHPWEWPSRPWSRIHIDYAGPFMGKMFLLVIDAYSKWLDVHLVNTANTQGTLTKLRQTFANHGLPEVIVSDNGTVFTSEEFKEFCRRNSIRHLTSAPYHPSTNGLVERAVQTFKLGMKKQVSGTIETKLCRFLLAYRTTPQATTGETPAQLRWGRTLRTHMDLLKPSVADRVETAQSRQKFQHDQHSKSRSFEVGDAVQIRNYSGNQKWVYGTVVERTGPISVKVQLDDGTIVRRHYDQLLKCRRQQAPAPREVLDEPEFQSHAVMEPIAPVVEQPRRYPTRNRGPPECYTYS